MLPLVLGMLLRIKPLNERNCMIKENEFKNLIPKGERLPKLVLDYEMYNCKVDSTKKDEGEINVSKRLLSSLLGNHKNFVDIFTYDALACNSKFINHCIKFISIV